MLKSTREKLKRTQNKKRAENISKTEKSVSVKKKTSSTKVVLSKKLSESSKKWLKRHINDPFVKASKDDNYRSRAAYKFIEINDKFSLLKRDARILDLGAAPGGWSQVISRISSNKSLNINIIAVDLLDFDNIKNVEKIIGDFNDPETLNKIYEKTNQKFDLIVSDMAPNTSGHKPTDHLKIVALADNVYEFAKENLAIGGSFVCKVFAGGTEGTLLDNIKKSFSTTKHVKPDASRKESAELYLVACGFKG